LKVIYLNDMNEKSYNQFENRETPLPKIETIRTSDGRESSFSPERGGIITSLKLNGKELLYLDPDTFNDRSKNVKGGIPILFPNAGPIEHPDYPQLKQHGFARTTPWNIDSMNEHGFIESLRSDETTHNQYPHDFSLFLKGNFENGSAFSIVQGVKNENADRAMPVAMGLHPYFRVPTDRKGDVKFNFPGGDKAQQQIEQWGNGKAVSLANPSTVKNHIPMHLEIPELGTLVLTASPEYQRIWIWSMKDMDFICVEPVMRDSGGLVNNPELVQPGQTLAPEVKIELQDQ
jgi:galactose mutarotase-like enzyme